MNNKQLAAHRDRIIHERGWASMKDLILCTRHYTHSDHRAVLAYELRHLDGCPKWPDIAVCIGFSRQQQHSTRRTTGAMLRNDLDLPPLRSVRRNIGRQDLPTRNRSHRTRADHVEC